MAAAVGPGALRSRSVPVWVHLARPSDEQNAACGGRGGRPRGCPRCVSLLFLGLAAVWVVQRLADAYETSPLAATLSVLGLATGILQLSLMLRVRQQPGLRFVLEARRGAGDKQEAAAALELKPATAAGGSRLVKVDTAALQRLGSCGSEARFEIAWTEVPSGSPRADEATGSLVALGEQPISVDGWIVPRGHSVELFDGSQISLLTEQEQGRYAVSLILGARFVAGNDKLACADLDAGARPGVPWRSAWFHRLGSRTSALLLRKGGGSSDSTECSEQPSISAGRSVSHRGLVDGCRASGGS